VRPVDAGVCLLDCICLLMCPLGISELKPDKYRLCFGHVACECFFLFSVSCLSVVEWFVSQLVSGEFLCSGKCGTCVCVCVCAHIAVPYGLSFSCDCIEDVALKGSGP